MFRGQKSPLFLIDCPVNGVKSKIFVSFLGFLSQEERPKSGAHSMFREQDCPLLPRNVLFLGGKANPRQ